MRTLPSQITNAIQGQEIWPVRLVDLSIGNTIYYISDHYKNITANTRLYLPNGRLLNIDNIVNKTAADDDSIEISLSAIESIFRTDIIAADAIGGTVTIYRGFVDSTTGNLLAAPTNLFSGIIYSVNLSEDYPTSLGGDSLEVTGFSATIDVRQSTFRLAETPGRYTNDASNKTRDSGDDSMEFVASLNGRNVRFGGS